MNGVVKVFYNIFRGLSRALCFIVVSLVCNLILLFTYEYKKGKQITFRKARRIRTLSKFKKFVFKNVPDNVIGFFGLQDYKNYFNKHISNGLQLC